MRTLTDDELRNELKANGIEPGPITPATREVYERKLQRLINEGKSGPKDKPTSRPSQAVKAEEISVRPAPRISIGRTAVVNSIRFVPRNRSLNESQEYPGHTPNPGLRSPLTPVNGDDLYSSPLPVESYLHHRPKSTPSTFQQSGPYSSTPLQSISCDERNTTSSQSRDRSFWASWLQRSNINSNVLSDESNLTTDEIVHRASPLPNLPRMDEETIDRSFSSRILGHSIGNQVPNVILFCGIILIIVIASSYLLLKDKHSNVGRIADIQKIVCHTGDNMDYVSTEVSKHQCVSSQDLPTILKIAHTLFDILSRFAGEHICGDSVESARMEAGTAKRLVKNAVTSMSSGSVSPYQVDSLWDNVLILITEVGRKHLDISAYDMDGQTPLSYRDVSELESLRPYIPGKCRIRLFFVSLLHFLQNLLWLIVIMTAVGGCCYLVYRGKQSHLNRTKRRTKRVQEIVKEVSCILQQQIERSQANRSESPHVPVTVLKDALRQMNPDLEDLWPEVEQYVHLVERNIAVGDWRGLGETWQWHAGSGWQGSAVFDSSQRLPFKVPPTQCLKVRNMFKADFPDINLPRLKRELLHRIQGCGDILHIGFDSVDGQGLVYIKCGSAEVAGRVFEAINANYFDGHMLTVKFLRPAKYHLRFPEASNVYDPLNVADL